jgi:hypothetical protein
LDGQSPFAAFPNSRHSGRFYSPEIEEQLLDMQRIYAYLQGGRWFWQVSPVGTFRLEVRGLTKKALMGNASALPVPWLANSLFHWLTLLDMTL